MEFSIVYLLLAFCLASLISAQDTSIFLNSSFPLTFPTNTSFALINSTSSAKSTEDKLSSVTIPFNSSYPVPAPSLSTLPPLKSKLLPQAVNVDSDYPHLNEFYPTQNKHRDLSTAITYLVKYLDRSNEGNQSLVWLKFSRNYDRQDCLLRLVCEISSNHEDPSDSPFVVRVRKVFRQREAPSYRVKRDNAFPFKYASFVGYNTGDAERCLEVFPVCPLSTEELLPLLSSYSQLLLPADRPKKQLQPQLQSSRKIPLAGLVPKQHPKMRRRMNELHQQFLFNSN